MSYYVTFGHLLVSRVILSIPIAVVINSCFKTDSIRLPVPKFKNKISCSNIIIHSNFVNNYWIVNRVAESHLRNSQFYAKFFV